MKTRLRPSLRVARGGCRCGARSILSRLPLADPPDEQVDHRFDLALCHPPAREVAVALRRGVGQQAPGQGDQLGIVAGERCRAAMIEIPSARDNLEMRGIGASRLSKCRNGAPAETPARRAASRTLTASRPPSSANSSAASIPDAPLYRLFLIPPVAVFALRMIGMASRRAPRPAQAG
jgi:hypothetical protein